MGGAPCFGPSPIDNELIDEIDRVAKRSVGVIPKNYTTERDRIVAEMKKSSPKPYQNLLHSEYPEKNQSKVNELAIKNITSAESKKQIYKEVNREVERRVDEKTAGEPEIARAAIRRAVEKAVEEAVDKAIDTSIEAIKKQ